MSDDVFSIDGHVFRQPKEQERYLRFIREEGAPLLEAYTNIECPKVRAALFHLVKVAAKGAAIKP